MRTLFLGGGTGGHLAPGIAVAEVLRSRGHDSYFLIAGREVELAMLGARGLDAEPLFGDTTRPAPWRLGSWMGATAKWRAAVRRFDPDVIVVLGGWVALPAVVTGFFGRPSVLIEQNALPGKVVRLLGPRVEHACLAVGGEDMPRGRATTRVTGNPTPALQRRERGEACRSLGLDPARRTLLLAGGSQGAADLNALAGPLVGVLAASGEPWQILNITGGRVPAENDAVDDVPVVRVDFLSDMGAAWCVADMAVCRAGAGTVSELANTGTPSVLVPYPHHADRHQEANARRLVEAGGALMTPRRDPSGRATVPELLRTALDRRKAMANAARGLARPEAARQVAEVVLKAAAC